MESEKHDDKQDNHTYFPPKTQASVSFSTKQDDDYMHAQARKVSGSLYQMVAASMQIMLKAFRKGPTKTLFKKTCACSVRASSCKGRPGGQFWDKEY